MEHKTDFDDNIILDRGVKNTLSRRIKESVFSTKNYNQSLTKIVEETLQRSIAVSIQNKIAVGTSATKQGEKA